MINENDNTPIVNALAAALAAVLPMVEYAERHGTAREPFTLTINGRPTAAAIFCDVNGKRYLALGDFSFTDKAYRLEISTCDRSYFIAFLVTNSQAFHDAINKPETVTRPRDLFEIWR